MGYRDAAKGRDGFERSWRNERQRNTGFENREILCERELSLPAQIRGGCVAPFSAASCNRASPRTLASLPTPLVLSGWHLGPETFVTILNPSPPDALPGLRHAPLHL
jgi:hypothetical protein